MKNFTLVLCFIIATQLGFAQQEVNTSFANKMNSMFAPLNKNYVPHGILLDFGMEFTNVPAFNGSPNDSIFTNMTRLKQVYYTLLSARIRDVSTGFVTPQDFDTRLKNNRSANAIAVSGLYFKYAKFDDNAVVDGKLRYENGKFYDKYINGVHQNPYQEMNAFAMSPAISIYKGLNLQVLLPSEIFYSNAPNDIQSIEMDFEDGRGYISVAFDQNVGVSYTKEGIYTWRYKLHLTDGTILYSQSKIKIKKGLHTVAYNTEGYHKGPNADDPYLRQTIQANIPYAGEYASVNLTIDLINGHSQITKPLIVAEGFDVGVILDPEDEHGVFDYDNFRDLLFLGGYNLKDLVYNNNKQYDIIFVDWVNGVDFMQRNAYALEAVIQWVNMQKANAGSTEPNVVLGQSMGGVIARYALADMEERGINHDTRLFISHDAPQQGANVPVGIQYMYRHLTKQYYQSSVALLGGNFVLPFFNNGVSGSDYLSLLDTPAAQQLLKNISASDFVVYNTPHENFMSDLKSNGLPGSGGYPQYTRNIAISNGSECGGMQDFNPGDDLVNYQFHEGLNFWQDLLSLILNPLGGVLGGNLVDPDFFAVAALGLLPGHSHYDVDLQVKSIPYGTGHMIYRGSVSYTKTILWLADVTVDITNVQLNQPSGVLPFDTYGGGYYHVSIDEIPDAVYLRDRFGFIPTTSALDIGKYNVPLDDPDYLRSYVGGNPPTGVKSSPFVNFTTDFDLANSNTHNRQHITFNRRNGDWLAKEILDTNIGHTDCSALCSLSEITGDNALCGSGTYSIDANIGTYWYISSGRNLASISNYSGGTTTLTQTNPDESGLVTLSAWLSSPECGSKYISKEIWVGAPDYKVIRSANGPINERGSEANIQAQQATFTKQGVNRILINWQQIAGNGSLYVLPDNMGVTGSGPNGWWIRGTVEVSNDCGVTEEPFFLFDHSLDCGNDSNNVYLVRLNNDQFQVVNPCKPAVKQMVNSAEIYDMYGVKIGDATHQEDKVTLSNNNNGQIIIIKANTNNNQASKVVQH